MLSAEEIAAAKKRTKYGTKDRHHEHDDCIRIAYEWLDAQPKTKGAVRGSRPLKHHIEKWGGRYVSQNDVEVAAQLHPHVHGVYPFYNISRLLILPSEARLARITQARSQDYAISARHINEVYGSRAE
ncbi:hypothetical protein WHZ78_16640 [Bradyrhizobium symbiodeficiens]|uniref:hypothetical protein n=1 Tax=Bradyrhizobium symbiodeficiens TaxID=1404367 RepID=UPI0030CFBDD9